MLEQLHRLEDAMIKFNQNKHSRYTVVFEHPNMGLIFLTTNEVKDIVDRCIWIKTDPEYKSKEVVVFDHKTATVLHTTAMGLYYIICKQPKSGVKA